jgi:hypothetical protein
MDGIKITKKGLLGFIRYKISMDRRWALRSLVVIYNEQEDDEKRFNSASHRNGRGFGKVDANALSAIAERFKRYCSVSEYDMTIIHRRMQKYSEQIYGLCNKPMLESQYRKYIISQERIIEGV